MKKVLGCGLLFLLCLAAGCDESANSGKPSGATGSEQPALTGQANATEHLQGNGEPEVVFETDGMGGIFFDDVHIAQAEYSELTDYLMQGSLEPDFYYIFHYPQGFDAQGDASVVEHVQRLAGENLFNGGQPRGAVFFKTHARADVVAAYEQERAAQPKEQPEGWDKLGFSDIERVYPIFIDYTISEALWAVSINFRIWSYSGGAHDNWTYSAITLDRRSGLPVTLEQLFSGPDSLEKTRRWLNETPDVAYSRQYKEGADEPVIVRQSIDLSGTSMAQEGLSMRRIVFTPEGLEVVFAPYEQGSFAMGDVRAFIPLAKMGELGINKEYWTVPEETGM